MAASRPPERQPRSVALVRSGPPRTLAHALRVALPGSGSIDRPAKLPLLPPPGPPRSMAPERVDALLPLWEDVPREGPQAKTLLFCALPCRQIAESSVARTARLGRDSHLVVTYGPSSPLSFYASPDPFSANSAASTTRDLA